MSYLEVYEHIVNYYPLGIDEFDPNYHNYSGIITLQEICQKKNGPHEYDKWLNFLKSINARNKGILEIDTISREDDRCFSAKVVLFRETSNSLTFTKEIQVHVSLLAPFYSVIGMDKVTVNATEKEFDPILYASPKDIYEPWFSIIRDKVELAYEDYRFLPYVYLKMRIKDLFIAGAETLPSEFGSVFQAFFTSFNLPNCQMEGDEFYE